MSKTLAERILDLSSDNNQLVKEAVRALSYIGVDAVEPLIQALRAGSVPFQPLAETFKQLGATAVDAVADLLRDPDPTIQQQAARMLAYMRNDRAVIPLLVALQASNETVRITLADALGNFSDVRAVGPLLDLLHKDTAAVRARVAVALGAYARDARVVPALLAALKDPMPLVRGGAVQGLARISGDERVQTALTAATSDVDDDVRMLAAAAQQHQRGDLMAFQRVQGSNVDAAVEEEVQRILADGKVNEDDLDAMRHSNPKVRARLLELVSDFGRTSAFKLMMPAMNDINPAVRKSAVEAIARLGQRALPDLAALVTHASAYTRQGAAEALGVIGDPQGVDALLQFLQDKEAQVRLAALSALRQFPADERIIAALKNAAQDADEAISQQATASLTQLGVTLETPNPIMRFFRRLTGGR